MKNWKPTTQTIAKSSYINTSGWALLTLWSLLALDTLETDQECMMWQNRPTIFKQNESNCCLWLDIILNMSPILNIWMNLTNWTKTVKSFKDHKKALVHATKVKYQLSEFIKYYERRSRSNKISVWSCTTCYNYLISDLDTAVAFSGSTQESNVLYLI